MKIRLLSAKVFHAERRRI